MKRIICKSRSIYIALVCIILASLFSSCTIQEPKSVSWQCFEEMYSIQRIDSYEGGIYITCCSQDLSGYYLYQRNGSSDSYDYLFTFPGGVELLYNSGRFYYCFNKRLYTYDPKSNQNIPVTSFDEGDYVGLKLVTDNYIVYSSVIWAENGTAESCSYSVLDLATLKSTFLFENEMQNNTSCLVYWAAGQGSWAACSRVYGKWVETDNDTPPEDITTVYDLQKAAVIPEIAIPASCTDMCVIDNAQLFAFDRDARQLLCYSLDDFTAESFTIGMNNVIQMVKVDDMLYLASKKEIWSYSLTEHAFGQRYQLEDLTLEGQIYSLEPDDDIGCLYVAGTKLFVTTYAGRKCYSVDTTFK